MQCRIGSGNIHGMVQKASTNTKRRGRPAKFDREQVVLSAINAFFEKGYEATTLGDIESATGVDRSTLYNSFGGKAGIYSSATSAYLAMAEEGLFGPLSDGTSDGDRDGYDAILEFLARLRLGLTTATTPGCLIVNDMAAGVDPAAAVRYRTMMEDGLRQALSRTGDEDVDRREERAGLLAVSVLGVNLVSKATGDKAEIGRHVDAMEREVRRWQAEG